MALKLGPLAESALTKKFPHQWEAIAVMLGLEFETDEHKVVIFTEYNEISITVDSQVATTIPIPDELIVHLISAAAQHDRAGEK